MTAGQTQGMDTDRRPLWQPFSETAAHPPLRRRDGALPAPVTAPPFLEPRLAPVPPARPGAPRSAAETTEAAEAAERRSGRPRPSRGLR
ncbi:hypothetical protein ACWEO1_38865 [Kitasatospora cineracea]